jgi:hypothetical protein
MNTVRLSYGAVRQILAGQKFHPYKMRTAQALFEEDKSTELNFAQDEFERI